MRASLLYCSHVLRASAHDESGLLGLPHCASIPISIRTTAPTTTAINNPRLLSVDFSGSWA